MDRKSRRTDTRERFVEAGNELWSPTMKARRQEQLSVCNLRPIMTFLQHASFRRKGDHQRDEISLGPRSLWDSCLFELSIADLGSRVTSGSITRVCSGNFLQPTRRNLCPLLVGLAK